MNKTCATAIFFIFFTTLITAQSSMHKVRTAGGQPQYKYLLYLPEKYDSVRKTKWPLIIYLHGRSACGDDLTKLKRYGMPFFLDRGMKIKAIVVSPQCPVGKNWTQEAWFDPFYLELIKKYNIDTTRIYLTGMSLGGFGTWDLAIRYPYRFAAIAPLCGGGRTEKVCAIRNVPVWAIHGDKDEQVPIGRSAEMINALEKCGGNTKFTILKNQPHDIHRTYSDENLYSWMFGYTKGKTFEQHSPNIVLKDTVQVKKSTVSYKKPIVEHQTVLKRKKKRETKALKDNHSEQTDTIRGKNFQIVF